MPGVWYIGKWLGRKGGQELVKIYDSGSLNTAEKTGKSDLVTKGTFSRPAKC